MTLEYRHGGKIVGEVGGKFTQARAATRVLKLLATAAIPALKEKTTSQTRTGEVKMTTEAKEITWTGPTLQKDLAQSLLFGDWMVWTQQPLGSVQHGNPPIVDVLAINKRYVNLLVRIYEVKVSRGDFLADVNRGKFIKYLPYCHQLYFAVPSGILAKDEIPQGAGLIVRNMNTWHTQKVASRRDCQLDATLLLTLLIKGYQDNYQRHRDLEEKKEHLNYAGLREAAHNFGLKVAHDVVEAQGFLKEAKEQKEEIEKVLGRSFPDLGNAIWTMRSEVQSLIAKYRHAEQAVPLARIALELLNGEGYYVGNAVKELKKIAGELEK